MKINFVIFFYLVRVIIYIKDYLCDYFWRLYTIGYFYKKRVVFNKINFKLYGRTLLNIDATAKVEIGDNLILRSGKKNGIGNNSCSKISVSSNAELLIGSNVGISNTVIQCKKQIVIGDYVNIGDGCIIFDSNFHSLCWEIRRDRNSDIANAINKPVAIGNDVFIGAKCVICKGVSIGDKSIVAAGSVVVKSIPSGEVWGGNPARYIGKI